MAIGVPHPHAGERAAERACERCGARFVEAEICPRCGAILGRLSTPLVLDGRYELERTLGVGSMGVVHLARDLRLGHAVAIKMIAPEIVREEAEATRRFAREAATLSAIRSPHVVRVHTYGQHDDAPYFVMEYVHGRDVGALVEEWATNGAWVPVPRTLTILRQVILGVEAVHAAGIIHRDIKPENVIIEEGTGRPVLVDFGVARSFGAAPRSRGPISTSTPWGRSAEPSGTTGAGTPCYMAPEQLDDDERAITPRTDVYALGCTAFELFAARPPFESFDVDELIHAHQTQLPPRLSSIRTDLARFDEPIARALRKRPDERFASAAAFFEELEACADDADLPPAGSLRTHPLSPLEGRRGPVSAMVVSDDDYFIRVAARALQLAFEGRPLDVTPAHSDEEAVTLAQWSAPRLVIVDDDLHRASQPRGRSRSIEAIARLRALPIGLDLHVVLASDAAPSERFRHDLVGVGALVRKPLDPQALRAELEVWARAHLGNFITM